MLRQSRINPKLSAHDQVFGTFNYQRTPLAPLGTKVIIHERPDQQHEYRHKEEEFYKPPSIVHFFLSRDNTAKPRPHGRHASRFPHFVPLNS